MIDRPAAAQKHHSLTLYALGAIFLAPLLIGVVMVRNSADRSDIANQVSRDIASMYSQGVDFSKAENQAIALRVAEGAGIQLDGGRGVVILSKLRIVKESDCAAGPCANLGLAGGGGAFCDRYARPARQFVRRSQRSRSNHWQGDELGNRSDRAGG